MPDENGAAVGEFPGINSSAGGRDAFANALETYRPRLVAFFRGRYRRSQEDAEDLASATILAVWRHADKYDSSRNFEAWLWKIAANHAIAEFRHDRRHPEIHSSDVDAFESLLPATAGGQDDLCAVMQALGALSELEQDLICLRHLAGLTPPEIAAVLGLNDKTTYRKCSAAEDKFRQSYGGALKKSSGSIGVEAQLRSHKLNLFTWRFGYARNRTK